MPRTNPTPADVKQAHDLVSAGERAADRIVEAGRAWPDHAEALAAWLSRGTYPGGALAALIDGDAWKLLQAGDLDTWRHARDIMRALYSQAPRQAIGAPGVATIAGACEDWRDTIENARATLRAAAEAQAAADVPAGHCRLCGRPCDDAGDTWGESFTAPGRGLEHEGCASYCDSPDSPWFRAGLDPTPEQRRLIGEAMAIYEERAAEIRADIRNGGAGW